MKHIISNLKPILNTRIVISALLYVATIIFLVVYIQSIGSELAIFSGLFFSSLVPIKPADEKSSHKRKRLSKAEQEQFSLTQNQEEMVVGLLLGDLCARKYKGSVNACLQFKQGIIHEDYLLDLYERFKESCPSALRIKTKILNPQPDKRTGKVYSSICFSTYSLPCFNDLYNLFYVEGKKVVPGNIGDLLTPLALAYWICDDGSWNKLPGYVVLCTECFTPADVYLLINVLNSKWNLKCYKSKRGDSYRIIIPSYSVPI